MVRKPLDELASLAPLAGLLLESTAHDLKEAMTSAEVDQAIVIAHPPYLTNDQLLEICAEHPQFIPAVNIPAGTERPGQVLKNLAKKGARILKIHAASDGEGADSPRYRALLKAAADLGLPVILHTGCIHSRVLYKEPELGNAERFANWFKTYTSTRFVLAHMNYHDPDVAIALAEEHPNLYVDTSWQPTETIGEAVRRLGAKKVLFGTDWPLVGNNIQIGIQRIRDCVETGTVSEQDSELILGKNAECLLNSQN
jgi:predicted TIM-barrel fold metal-dependent hydrolase